MESNTRGLIHKPLTTVVVGSGNIASAIAPALEAAGAIRVRQVYSPTESHARELAEKLDCAEAVSDPKAVVSGADLYLIAVKDDAIATLAESLNHIDGGVWLHTSGGVDCRVLTQRTPDVGVFYPLQTFSKGRDVDLTEVPVFIEGATPKALQTSRMLAEAISPKVYEADGPKRARLHAAAVFACNFTNHLWAIADEVLRRETQTDLSVLSPLIRETMAKALAGSPAEGQTGPAIRGDQTVIERHKSLLKPDEADLYDILSEHIMNFHNVKQR